MISEPTAPSDQSFKRRKTPSSEKDPQNAENIGSAHQNTLDQSLTDTNNQSFESKEYAYDDDDNASLADDTANSGKGYLIDQIQNKTNTLFGEEDQLKNSGEVSIIGTDKTRDGLQTNHKNNDDENMTESEATFFSQADFNDKLSVMLPPDSAPPIVNELNIDDADDEREEVKNGSDNEDKEQDNDDGDIQNNEAENEAPNEANQNPEPEEKVETGQNDEENIEEKDEKRDEEKDEKRDEEHDKEKEEIIEAKDGEKKEEDEIKYTQNNEVSTIDEKAIKVLITDPTSYPPSSFKYDDLHPKFAEEEEDQKETEENNEKEEKVEPEQDKQTEEEEQVQEEEDVGEKIDNELHRTQSMSDLKSTNQSLNREKNASVASLPISNTGKLSGQEDDSPELSSSLKAKEEEGDQNNKQEEYNEKPDENENKEEPYFSVHEPESPKEKSLHENYKSEEINDETNEEEEETVDLSFVTTTAPIISISEIAEAAINQRDYSNINDQNYEQVVSRVRKIQRDALKDGDYELANKAQVATNQIVNYINNERFVSINESKEEEIRNQLGATKNDISFLKEHWAIVLKNAKEQMEQDLANLEQENEEELSEFDMQLQSEPPIQYRKVSPEVLQLRRQQKAMVASKRYKEAKILKEEADKLEHDELEKNYDRYRKKYETDRIELIKKQENKIFIRKENWTRTIDGIKRVSKYEIGHAVKSAHQLEKKIESTEELSMSVRSPRTRTRSLKNRKEQEALKFRQRAMINKITYSNIIIPKVKKQPRSVR